jgi:hypothetical protein
MPRTEELTLVLKVLSDKLVAGLNTVQTTLTKVTSSGDKVNQVMTNLDTLIKGVIIEKIGKGLFDIGKQFVDSASQVEQYRLRLSTLFGDVTKGEKAFEWVKEFAEETPFEIPGVAQASTILTRFGQDATKWLPLIGGLAAVSGHDLSYMAEVFGKALSGSAMGLKSLRNEFGVDTPVLRSYGATMDGTRVNVQSLQVALKNFLTDQGGAKALEKFSKTYAGQMSMVNDSIFKLKYTLGERLLPELTPFIKFLTSLFDHLLPIGDIFFNTAHKGGLFGRALISIENIIMGTIIWFSKLKLSFFNVAFDIMGIFEKIAAFLEEPPSFKYFANIKAQFKQVDAWTNERKYLAQKNYDVIDKEINAIFDAQAGRKAKQTAEQIKAEKEFAAIADAEAKKWAKRRIGVDDEILEAKKENSKKIIKTEKEIGKYEEELIKDKEKISSDYWKNIDNQEKENKREHEKANKEHAKDEKGLVKNKEKINSDYWKNIDENEEKRKAAEEEAKAKRLANEEAFSKMLGANMVEVESQFSSSFINLINQGKSIDEAWTTSRKQAEVSMLDMLESGIKGAAAKATAEAIFGAFATGGASLLQLPLIGGGLAVAIATIESIKGTLTSKYLGGRIYEDAVVKVEKGERIIPAWSKENTEKSIVMNTTVTGNYIHSDMDLDSIANKVSNKIAHRIISYGIA